MWTTSANKPCLDSLWVFLKASMISSEEGIRLAKRVAAEQNCSRREAEALIVAGGVQVAGQVVTDPARRVREEQTVQVNRLVSMAALAPMTLVLFKPAHRVANSGLAARHRGPQSTPARHLGTCSDLSKMHMPLPLAKPTSGLCIFTDDVSVLRHLEDRRSPMEQEWMATVGGEVPEEPAQGTERARHPGQHQPPNRPTHGAAHRGQRHRRAGFGPLAGRTMHPARPAPPAHWTHQFGPVGAWSMASNGKPRTFLICF
jgi:hypothetical protein